MCVCVCLWGGRKRTQGRFWFTGISRMWKNRINNAPLRSSNTQRSCTAKARGTSTHTYAHHYVRANTKLSLGKTNHCLQNSAMYKSKALYDSLSVTHYQRPPSVSPAIAPSYLPFIFCFESLALSLSSVMSVMYGSSGVLITMFCIGCNIFLLTHTQTQSPGHYLHT